MQGGDCWRKPVDGHLCLISVCPFFFFYSETALRIRCHVSKCPSIQSVFSPDRNLSMMKLDVHSMNVLAEKPARSC